MTLTQNVQNLHSMVLSGNSMQAFEKFYAEDCVVQENETPPRVGRTACRKFENEFFGSIQSVDGGSVKSFSVNE